MVGTEPDPPEILPNGRCPALEGRPPCRLTEARSQLPREGLVQQRFLQLFQRGEFARVEGGQVGGGGAEGVEVLDNACLREIVRQPYGDRFDFLGAAILLGGAVSSFLKSFAESNR